MLKITRALSEASATTTPKLCIRALAELVESPGERCGCGAAAMASFQPPN